jgi:hypothetical protein
MPRGKSGKRGSRGKSKGKREPIRWELGASIDSKVWGVLNTEERRQLLHQAASHAIRTGEELPGVQLIGRWRNPENKNPLHSNWKSTQMDGQQLTGPKGFFATIHGARYRYQNYNGPVREPLQRKPMGTAKRAVAPAPALGPPTKRSAAQSAYQGQLRAIREQHPKWNQKRVQEKYRAQKAATVAREKKAKAKGKRK